MTFPSELLRLPPGAYRALATYYANLARVLDHYADDYERGTDRWRELNNQLGTSRRPADIVAAYLANGMGQEAAIDAAVQLTGESRETITWAWRSKYNIAEKEKREALMARVYRYHNAGLRPGQISKVTGVKISTVRDWIKSAA